MEIDLSEVELGDRNDAHRAACATSRSATLHRDAEVPGAARRPHRLPNRVLFEDRVNQAIRPRCGPGSRWRSCFWTSTSSSRSTTPWPPGGDEVLKLVAERLVDCLREGDTVARLGGDEFGILPLGGTDLAGGGQRGVEDRAGARGAVPGRRHSVEMRASIGMALAPITATTSTTCCGGRTWPCTTPSARAAATRVFAAEQEEEPARRLALLDDLATASSATSSSCTTSRRSTSRPGARPGSRR